MLANMKAQTTDGLAELSLSVPVNVLASVLRTIDENTEAAEVSLTLPKKDLAYVMKALSEILAAKGHGVPEVNEDGEELYSVEEVFPEENPAMTLRGLRGKEELT